MAFSKTSKHSILLYSQQEIGQRMLFKDGEELVQISQSILGLKKKQKTNGPQVFNLLVNISWLA